jgi:surface antigen
MRYLVLSLATLTILITSTVASDARYRDLDVGLRGDDTTMMTNAVRQGLDGRPVGTLKSWSNPETGSHGSVELIDQYELENRPCREVRHRFFTNAKGSKTYVVDVTACQMADGEWKWPSAPKIRSSSSD